ncbi:MAG TPA: zinc ribbon domain-containing protein [Pyrinomonadaceae bacterium]|nr:zinc ribbon domain-containing protein [Pyrinomonadaceae bacterium]
MRRTVRAGETLTCPSCLTVNQHSAGFCKECGAPIGAVSTLDPMQTIQSEGFLFRKAVTGRPKPIVLLGIWILNLPAFAVSLGVAIYLLLNKRGWADFIFFWGAVAISFITFVILYKVTRNYLTIPRKPEG